MRKGGCFLFEIERGEGFLRGEGGGQTKAGKVSVGGGLARSGAKNGFFRGRNPTKLMLVCLTENISEGSNCRCT